MDVIYFLNADARNRLLRTIAETIGCTYICLWSCDPLVSNCVFSIDGWYNEKSNQLSSSSGSLTRRLFDTYRKSQYTLDISFVPGFAFKEGIPYLELNQQELVRRTSNITQRQFYQEAQIKSAAFLSCRSGEMEIGMSRFNQVNMKFEIDNLFQQFQFDLPDQDWYSSYSSSLSASSQESSPLFYTMPTSSTSYMPEFNLDVQIEQTPTPSPTPTPTLSPSPQNQQQAKDVYSRLSIQNLDPESDNATMAKAMLAVISSPSSSSSSYNQPQHTLNYNSPVSQNTGAPKHYTSALAPNHHSKGKQNMFKRSGYVMSNIPPSWREEGNPQTNSQLHHKLSERKRREKLKESFEELRPLLPPSTKKDKASVLLNTLDYLTTLKTEVSELTQNNELLEARATSATKDVLGFASNEKFDICIVHSSSVSLLSEEQDINMQVTVRGDCNIVDLILDILEYLKLVKEANLVSMDADTELLEPIPINRIIFRMEIKVSEWDEPAFYEAMRRIVADVAN
ncbi:hypothetical protein ACHQM5_026974 [Ranunculus cassubicifolius]